MNILIASIFNYNSYSRGIMPDVLQTQIEENPGANIFYLTNSGSFDICYFNLEKKPEICYHCSASTKNTLKLIQGEFKHIKVADILNGEDFIKAKEFFQHKDRISFDHVYENFEVGAATLSTYISNSRDRELTNVTVPFVKELAINSLALYLGVKRFLQKENINVVYNFNGRQEYVRAIFRGSQALKITCFNVERARSGGYLEFFKDTLPHSISRKMELVDKCWEGAQETYPEKIKIGASFFYRQRSGESVIYRTHLKRQIKDTLPDFIRGENNFVLFTSSDDEFAALGEDFKNPVFNDQFEGIEYLVELVGKEFPDKNLIIRMHPNLKDVTFQYAIKIKEQHLRYPNIFVVFPESTVDSYALLDIAEKVISFGSTIGMEATFHKKPSILLGKSYFYYSNVGYTPKSKIEVSELLFSELQPLPKENALKFGYYYLNSGDKARHYFENEIGGKIYFKKKEIPFFNIWQRIKKKLIEKGIFSFRKKCLGF